MTAYESELGVHLVPLIDNKDDMPVEYADGRAPGSLDIDDLAAMHADDDLLNADEKVCLPFAACCQRVAVLRTQLTNARHVHFCV